MRLSFSLCLVLLSLLCLTCFVFLSLPLCLCVARSRRSYPFNISKSSLQSVGAPHTWPAVLAALTWLIELISFASDPLSATSASAAASAAGSEGGDDDADAAADPVKSASSASASASSSELELDSMNRDRLYFDKLAHAYGIFMQGGDDVPYLEQELAASFVAESAAITAELEAFERDIRRIEADTAQLEAAQPPLVALSAQQSALMARESELDAEATDDEQALAAERAALASVHAAADAREAELRAHRGEQQDILRVLAQQDAAAVDIARMTHEKSMLDDTLATLARQRDDLAKRVRDQEANIGKRLAEIQQNVLAFNELATGLQLIPAGAAHATDDCDLELRFRAPAPDAAHVRDVVNYDLKARAKPALQRLKEEFGDRIRQLVREVREQAKRADNMRERQEEKRDEAAKLDAACREERDAMNKELTRQVSEVEDIELELRKLQNAQNDAVAQMQVLEAGGCDGCDAWGWGQLRGVELVFVLFFLDCLGDCTATSTLLTLISHT
jgi:kinetochore protein NDC80